MSMSSLKDVYLHQLKDLYSANKQALNGTEKLRDAASESALVDALEAGRLGIQEGINCIESVLAAHHESATGEHCKGMEGLVKEARAHALDADFNDAAVRDAMIITQYQRMVHYAIAGYGCLAAFAKRLELDKDYQLIDHCLDSTYDGDRRMTDIATDGVNQKAV